MKDKNETLLDEIFDISAIHPEITDAKAYGISTNEKGELKSVLIDFNPDVYDLIEEIRNQNKHLLFEYVSLVTTGWAAPLNDNGEVDGAPSKHPDRRRVALAIAVNIANKNIFGSVIKFDDADEKVYDFNNATGSLAEAINELF
jgi:hypothetical protein